MKLSFDCQLICPKAIISYFRSHILLSEDNQIRNYLKWAIKSRRVCLLFSVGLVALWFAFQSVETPIGYAFLPLMFSAHTLMLDSDEQDISLPVAAELPAMSWRSGPHYDFNNIVVGFTVPFTQYFCGWAQTCFEFFVQFLKMEEHCASSKQHAVFVVCIVILSVYVNILSSCQTEQFSNQIGYVSNQIGNSSRQIWPFWNQTNYLPNWNELSMQSPYIKVK